MCIANFFLRQSSFFVLKCCTGIIILNLSEISLCTIIIAMIQGLCRIQKLFVLCLKHLHIFIYCVHRPSRSCLPSFLCHPYIPCFLIQRIFCLLVSTSFYMHEHYDRHCICVSCQLVSCNWPMDHGRIQDRAALTVWLKLH